MQHAMATDPAPVAPVESIPPSDASKTQAPQANSPSKQPQPQSKYMRIETTVSLGAIQIMTGLVHISLGALSIDIIVRNSAVPKVTFAGYPFWGGALFIFSGSLTVFAANYSWNIGLMRLSLALNCASAIAAIIGIMLYVFQLTFGTSKKYDYDPHILMAKVLSVLLCGLLICFSFLEFCIAMWAAHIQDNYELQMPEPVDAPYTYGFAVVPSEGNPTSSNP